MANFNEKVLCLFSKSYDQLKKEACRRGLPYEGKEKTIAKILWKDAYDTGFNEGKDLAITVARRYPANCCGNVKSEVNAYCLYDINDDKRYRLELTEEQANAINWLINKEFLIDVLLSEWSDTYEDIGRI